MAAACRHQAQLPTFAVCAGMADYASVAEAGYDYIETYVSYLMPDKSDAEFREHLDEINAQNAKIVSCVNFFPASLKITGSETKHPEALAWADSAFRRAQAAGIPRIVFGSGGARKVPEGFDKQEATAQFVTFCKQLALSAERYGITVLIEPLNSNETNFINSLAEGAQIVEAVNHPNFKMVCDIYHMLRENEPASEIVKYGAYIQHCHIAEKEERSAPGVKGDDFIPYFKALREIGYSGCVSVECKWKNMQEELKPALAYLKQQADF
jgi:sugar phosphate isomerase/epimerase